MPKDWQVPKSSKIRVMKHENITAPKAEFDALLGKLLNTPPLPKAAIAPKRVRRSIQPRKPAKPQPEQ